MATHDSARRHPHVVFYGDSILTGWRGTTSPSRRWPALVAERLGWRETTLAVDGMGFVRRRGPRDASGECVPSDTDTTLLDAAIRLAPDVVVVCLGANDLQLLDAWGPRVESSIRRDLGRLRDELPDAHVVVTTYFPGAALSERATVVHGWVVEVCGSLGLSYVEDFRLAIDGARDWLCDDGVHPNDLGHRVLADVMVPVLGGLLDRRRSGGAS